MRWFLYRLLLLVAAAAVAGWYGLGWGLLIALGLAGMAGAVEYLRAQRLIEALRTNSVSALSGRGAGVWGEVAQRVARLLRERDERIRDSEARLQEFLVALETSPNGVVLLDDQARIEWCNQTAADHFGFDATRDRMQFIGNLVRDPAFAAYMASWNYSRDVVLTVPKSGTLPLRLSVQAHPYAGNRRLLLSRDVTAVEHAEAMRRDFVANVSHEIRTPLTVLAGFVETLQTLPLEAQERQRYLDLMATQARRMQTLVDDLLTLSRLEGNPPPGMGEWVRLSSLVAQAEHEARALSSLSAPRQPHVLALEVPHDVEVSGSPAELQSAVSNLVSNAVRYTPPGGRIDLSWHEEADGRGELRVRDTGPGIAAEHLPRLTERFYRVDRSRSRETGGTGLGLAIVKHALQRHGAELRIESTIGTGSTFTIVLPRSRLRHPVRPDAAGDAPPATGSAEVSHSES